MLLAAVGHTAVHVADWGDVVLVVDGARHRRAQVLEARAAAEVAGA